MIDSEQVPRGKGEKQPGEGDEIVSETIRLQRASAGATHRNVQNTRAKMQLCILGFVFGIFVV